MASCIHFLLAGVLAGLSLMGAMVAIVYVAVLMNVVPAMVVLDCNEDGFTLACDENALILEHHDSFFSED